VDSIEWEASWEVAFPATSPEELLLALVVRDLLHGDSVDLELDEEGSNQVLAVDYLAGDEEQEDGYRLLVTARVEGTEAREALQQLTERLLEQLVDEAEALVDRRQLLETVDLGALAFVPVPEEEERWDLVVPDWLAPDGAEVPFGRLVVVPHAGSAHLYAIPAPVGDESLPVIP
jgi:hypothetical protein